MKHFVKTSVATAVILGATLAASGALASVAGSIVNTRHNMGSEGLGPNTASAADTAEICIFCHTPHGGSTTDALGNRVAVPLWNKLLTDPVLFTTYDQLGTSTLDAAVGQVGSVSLACLTCHDGTQAIDNVINAPGSGGYSADGGDAGSAGGRTWTWNSADNTLNGDGAFIGSVDTGGTNIWAIGTDLTNDHPISMQYGGGGYSATNPEGFHFTGTLAATRDQDFEPALQIGSGARWYVDNNLVVAPGETLTDGFDKWDFKLYTRDTSTGMQTSANLAEFAGQDEPFVECGSCHDPHFQTTTFLRMDGATDLGGGNPSPAGSDQSNAGSRVCLVCHTK